MPTPDRLEQLTDPAQTRVTGVDFLYVYNHDDQTTLDVFFLKSPAELDSPSDPGVIPLLDITPDQVRIHEPSGRTARTPIAVTRVEWKRVAVVDGALEDRGDWDGSPAPDDEHPVLRVHTARPGDFTQYRFRLHQDPSFPRNHPQIDPFFNNVPFSFKAGCERDLDCLAEEEPAVREEDVEVPVDYRARDFWSFRRALLDFASLRYPDWKDRLEADVGVMLVEMMSAVGDEMAYYQDRIAREGYLETATQRRSLRRHARLVDYHVHDGLGGRTRLNVQLTPEAGLDVHTLPAGLNVWAVNRKGERVEYEVGEGLHRYTETTSTDDTRWKGYPVSAVRNELIPHRWDEDELQLPAGSTELYIRGLHRGTGGLEPGTATSSAELSPGETVLLQTHPEDPSRPARARMVQLTRVEETYDPLLDQPLTRLGWAEDQALPLPMDLTDLRVHANMVPATAGTTRAGLFLVGRDPADPSVDFPPGLREQCHRAVERSGPDGVPAFLFTLPGSAEESLVWLGEDPRRARPEIQLQQVSYDAGTGRWTIRDQWQWRRSLLGSASSQPNDTHFTLDDGNWARVAGYHREGTETIHVDYASGSGVTLRFGNGEFGRLPEDGTLFRVVYRLGGGRKDNVPPDSINRFQAGMPEEEFQFLVPEFDPGASPVETTFEFLESITNPLPVENAEDPESPEEIRNLAPEAFQNETFRAVRPVDYAEAAERLSWVQNAGARFRWTGSWQSAFVTPDPRGSVTLSGSQRDDLQRQLNRVRQAGRETHPSDPRYADLDLRITVCVEPHAYTGEVREAVLERLQGTVTEAGFFSPDRFTFGTPLNRLSLEAAIQGVPGVRAVDGIRIRRRGWFDWRPFAESSYEVGKDHIVRVENDPLHPNRGSLVLNMEGGA